MLRGIDPLWLLASPGLRLRLADGIPVARTGCRGGRV